MADARTEWVSLTDASAQLSQRYHATLDDVLCRRLTGEKRGTRWWVLQSSIDRLIASRANRVTERSVVPATA